MIVAIDGPAGSGKSTIAKEIARQLGFNKLDTGAMYRAVTFAALDRGIDLDDEAAIDALAEQIEIRFTNGTGEDTRLTIDGQDASAAIRTPQVDANVSKVSAYPGVRAAMLIHQRRAAEDRDIVAEGRDIGTVVFPNAQVKVFLTADPRERARRRKVRDEIDDAPYDRESARVRILQYFQFPLARLTGRDGVHRVAESVQMDAARDPDRHKAEPCRAGRRRQRQHAADAPQCAAHHSHQREGAERVPHIFFVPVELRHRQGREHGERHRNRL